jgi:hypothetical protein
MTTTVDVLPTIVLPKLQMMQLRTLPEEWKMAGDSERHCVLSIVERWDGLVHQGIRYILLVCGFPCFFALYMMISYLGIGLRGRDFDYPASGRVAAGSIQTTCGYISICGEDIRLIENTWQQCLSWTGFLHLYVLDDGDSEVAARRRRVWFQLHCS